MKQLYAIYVLATGEVIRTGTVDVESDDANRDGSTILEHIEAILESDDTLGVVYEKYKEHKKVIEYEVDLNTLKLKKRKQQDIDADIEALRARGIQKQICELYSDQQSAVVLGFTDLAADYQKRIDKLTGEL